MCVYPLLQEENLVSYKIKDKVSIKTQLSRCPTSLFVFTPTSAIDYPQYKNNKPFVDNYNIEVDCLQRLQQKTANLESGKSNFKQKVENNSEETKQVKEFAADEQLAISAIKDLIIQINEKLLTVGL